MQSGTRQKNQRKLLTTVHPWYKSILGQKNMPFMVQSVPVLGGRVYVMKLVHWSFLFGKKAKPQAQKVEERMYWPGPSNIWANSEQWLSWAFLVITSIQRKCIKPRITAHSLHVIWSVTGTSLRVRFHVTHRSCFSLRLRACLCPPSTCP